MQGMMKLIARAVLGGVMLFSAIHGAAAQQESIRIGISSTGLLFMPVLVADSLDYFADEGVDVEILAMSGANNVYSALISGDIQLSVSSSMSILQGRSSGVDLLMVGSAMNQHGSNIVVSKEWADEHGLTEDSSYEERLAALRGLTIGTSSVGGGSDQLVRLLAEEAGLDPDRDMTLTVLAVGDATLAAFAMRRVDAITHSSPVAVRAIREHDGMMMFHLTGGAVPIYDGLIYLAYSTNEDWARENPDTLRKTLKALQRAHAVIGDEGQREIVKKAVQEKYHARIDDELYEAAWQDYATAFPAKIDLDQDSIDQVMELAQRLGMGQGISADVAETSWSNEFITAGE